MSSEKEMQDHPDAPAPRTSQSTVRELQRDAVFVEAAVAFVLVLSICALLYLLSLDVRIGT